MDESTTRTLTTLKIKISGDGMECSLVKTDKRKAYILMDVQQIPKFGQVNSLKNLPLICAELAGGGGAAFLPSPHIFLGGYPRPQNFEKS